jgi:hypothetical protein
MACCLAMMTGRTYEQVTEAAQALLPVFKPGSLMTHSLMRRIAHQWGFALLSSIYMDWRYPGIVGVLSRTIANCGHALFWDGKQLIDPGNSDRYDLEYVRLNAIEFTQRASHLSTVMSVEQLSHPASSCVSDSEYF